MKIKYVALFFVNLLAIVWQLVPNVVRTHFVTGLFLLESRGSNVSRGLSRLISLRDRLDWVLNERAMVYGNGEHPKHRLTNYHQFFISRIRGVDKVLDVGCGYGAVARSIAFASPATKVVGIDSDHGRLQQAKTSPNPDNLTFIFGDATKDTPSDIWDVVVMSNVLEHIEDRVGFLTRLKVATRAKRFLIRVPLFERDWMMPLRKELKINYYSDTDHKIEHTVQELRGELSESGFEIIELLTIWGEIWVECQPIGS